MLAWLLGRPGVSSAIVGARTTAQLQESLASEDVELPAEIVQAVEVAAEEVAVEEVAAEEAGVEATETPEAEG